MNDLLSLLQKAGLRKQESTVYLSLVELREAKTGLLCKKTGIASSNIYRILDSLLRKGLASYRLKNNTKIFMPAPPEALNELFHKRKQELEQERIAITDAIDSLRKRPIPKDEQANYKYYEGISGIKGMMYELNQALDPKKLMRVYTTNPEGYERLVGFFTEHHDLRLKLGVHEKILFPLSDRDLAKKRLNEYAKIKFLPLQNEAEWGVVEDLTYIFYSLSKQPRGFLIKDRIIADTFGQVFDQLWERAKD